jgi:hypothetical protein
VKDLLLSSALAWLRYEKRCFLVATERRPFGEWHHGRPDAIGVDVKRFMTEIEIKVTLSDFRANQKKRCVKNREMFIVSAPRQFYFMVPPQLVEKVQPELPGYAGLMTISDLGFSEGCKDVQVIRPAPVNKASRELTVKELYDMAKHQSGTLCSMARFLAVKTPNL